MTQGLVRCIRCKGRGKMYRLGNGYSQTNMGGTEVNCPLCTGEGKIEPLDNIKPVEAEVRQETKDIKADGDAKTTRKAKEGRKETGKAKAKPRKAKQAT